MTDKEAKEIVEKLDKFKKERRESFWKIVAGIVNLLIFLSGALGVVLTLAIAHYVDLVWMIDNDVTVGGVLFGLVALAAGMWQVIHIGLIFSWEADLEFSVINYTDIIIFLDERKEFKRMKKLEKEARQMLKLQELGKIIKEMENA
jgi:uncharacterized membrane protein YcjF (UPF0283 family)